MKATRFAFVVVLALLLVPLTAVVAQQLRTGGDKQKDVMNDRFGEKFDPPAGGFVRTETEQDGSIEIERVRIENLPSGQVFKVVVAVGADGDTGFAPVVIVEGDPIEIEENGELRVRDFSVGSFAPGTYRVDILVLRAEQALADFNFISACEPAPFVTVR